MAPPLLRWITLTACLCACVISHPGVSSGETVDFKLEDQSAPLSAEIEAALQNVGVEDAAEEAAAEGGQAPAEKTDAGSETKKPEPAPADDAGEASPATTPDK